MVNHKDYKKVIAVPYDMYVAGMDGKGVSVLRLSLIHIFFVLKRDLFTARFVVLSRKLNFQTFAGTFRYAVDCIFSNMNGHTCFLRNQTV